MSSNCAYSVTFCDRAENHAGMQMIGSLADSGFSVADLEQAQAAADRLGIAATVHHLHELLPEQQVDGSPAAAVLVLAGAAEALLSGEEPNGAAGLLDEMAGASYDEQALMGRGAGRKVKTKHARHNHCIADCSQQPDIGAGKGTVVPFSSLPELQALRAALPKLFGPKAKGLVAETNKYFDVRKCGIGWHGDAERRIVIGLRLGAATTSMPLKFQWFQRSKPMGMVLEIGLNHGDMYVMSEKATGSDWLVNKKGLTIRHAAGADKYARNKEPLSGVKRGRAAGVGALGLCALMRGEW